MDEREVPEDVRSLLLHGISSYEELEILLLLARDPAATVTADSAAAGVRTNGSVAAGALARLHAAGLVERDSGVRPATFRYLPGGPHGQAVEALVHETRDNPLGIIKLMSANAIERIRMSALHVFADAFVLGKDPGKLPGKGPADERDVTDG